jgi:DNA-binding NtrC family response regulator
MALLQSYAWPGNVRELENVIERATILSGKQTVQRQHLPADIQQNVITKQANFLLQKQAWKPHQYWASEHLFLFQK